MKRFKGTKERWEHGGGDNMNCEVNIGEAIITVHRYQRYSDEPSYSREEMLANANLIVTALELLEVLIELVDMVDEAYTGNNNGELIVYDRDFDSARETISKALNIEK